MVSAFSENQTLALAFLTAALTFSRAIRPWHIIVLAFGFGLGNAFDAPARQAIVQELVDPLDMTNAIALTSAMFNMATALGPAVGGVLYSLFSGPPGVSPSTGCPSSPSSPPSGHAARPFVRPAVRTPSDRPQGTPAIRQTTGSSGPSSAWWP
jgi:MFS family permease